MNWKELIYIDKDYLKLNNRNFISLNVLFSILRRYFKYFDYHYYMYFFKVYFGHFKYMYMCDDKVYVLMYAVIERISKLEWFVNNNKSLKNDIDKIVDNFYSSTEYKVNVNSEYDRMLYEMGLDYIKDQFRELSRNIPYDDYKNTFKNLIGIIDDCMVNDYSDDSINKVKEFSEYNNKKYKNETFCGAMHCYFFNDMLQNKEPSEQFIKEYELQDLQKHFDFMLDGKDCSTKDFLDKVYLSYYIRNVMESFVNNNVK